MVSTVDAFQGGERDVIILSCVRTRNVGFIDNEKYAGFLQYLIILSVEFFEPFCLKPVQ